MPSESKSRAWRDWSKRDDAIGDLCARIEDGDSLTHIAESLGVKVSTLTMWIARDDERSARARESRIAAASAYADLALKTLQEARDPFEVQRAREIASHYRWQASKANPAGYGDKIELGGGLRHDVTVTQAQRDAAVKAATG